MKGFESFLPPQEPVTKADVDKALHMFLRESFSRNPGFTKDQHIDYATHATAIYLNIDDRDLEGMK